jgi:hypothetical protein
MVPSAEAGAAVAAGPETKGSIHLLPQGYRQETTGERFHSSAGNVFTETCGSAASLRIRRTSGVVLSGSEQPLPIVRPLRPTLFKVHDVPANLPASLDLNRIHSPQYLLARLLNQLTQAA